jgi:hypothetical protein
MSHIADLYNNGKCGLHRTLQQARGGFHQLIMKEARAVEASFERSQVEALGIRCPQCSSVVSAARCQHCRFFPIPIPRNVLECSTKSHVSGALEPSRLRPSTQSRTPPVSRREFSNYVSSVNHQIEEEHTRTKQMLARVNKLLSAAEQL